MKYITAISTLILLNIFTAVTLVYFGKISRGIEKVNDKAKFEIIKLRNQLNINELEYSIHNDYSYLIKLKKIYLVNDEIDNELSSIVSLTDFKDKEIINIYKVSSN